MINSALEFHSILSSDDPDDYHRARYDSTSEAVWLDLINSYPEDISWVILNKSVPLSILRILASHPDEKIRADVAMKRKLDAKLFEQLAIDESEFVRSSLANNMKAPLGVLEILADDPNSLIRETARRRFLKRNMDSL